MSHHNKSRRIHPCRTPPPWRQPLMTFLVISLQLAVCSGSNNAGESRVKTYPINTEGDGSPPKFACRVDNAEYPCVETVSNCTSSGGKLAGFCFYQGEFEGLCCNGVDMNGTATETIPTTALLPPKERSISAQPKRDFTTRSPERPKTARKRNLTRNPSIKGGTPHLIHDSYETFSEESLTDKPHSLEVTPSSSQRTTPTSPKETTTTPTSPPQAKQPTTETPNPVPVTTSEESSTTRPRGPVSANSSLTASHEDASPFHADPLSDPPTSSTFSPESLEIYTTEASVDNSSTIDPSLLPTIILERITLTALKVSSHPLLNVTSVSQSINSTISSSNSSSQSYDFTNKHLNFTSFAFPNLTVTVDSMNLTTQVFNVTLSNATQSQPNDTLLADSHLPQNTTIEDLIPEVEKYTAADTLQVPSLDTRPVIQVTGFSNPQPLGGPKRQTFERQAMFRNPSYPKWDTEANVHEFAVVPLQNFCALRIEFVEALLAGKGVEGCTVDSVIIVNTPHGLTLPQCGFLQGYQFTVNQTVGKPVKIVVTTRSPYHLWSINLTQVPCSSDRSYRDFEYPDCGLTNPKEVVLENLETQKLVHPVQLLRSSKKARADVFISDSYIVPTRLLQNAVLNLDEAVAILKGEETAMNEFPWQALLMIYGRPLCGASIINEHWLLTAAHCVFLPIRLPLIFALTVNLGDHDLRTTNETPNLVLRVSKIIPHVQYDGIRNDVALIKVASKIPMGRTIWPVCFPEDPEDSYAFHAGVTTGWGRTGDSVISPVLRSTGVPILSQEECVTHWESMVGEAAGAILDSSMVCAGGGNVATCNGDGGGPLVVQEDDGRYRLVGVTSFGLLRSCPMSGVPVVYARVTSFLDWIALSLSSE